MRSASNCSLLELALAFATACRREARERTPPARLAAIITNAATMTKFLLIAEDENITQRTRGLKSKAAWVVSCLALRVFASWPLCVKQGLARTGISRIGAEPQRKPPK